MSLLILWQLLPSKDQKLLYQLEFEDEQMLFAKVSVSGVTSVPTKEEAEVTNSNHHINSVNIMNYYMDGSILPGTKTLVESICSLHSGTE